MKKIKTPPSPDFRPLYVQVMEIISKRIEKGEWGPGEVLPAEPKFAEELGVSQGTVRKALDNIARKKIVVRRQGRGTFVAEHSPDMSLFRFFRIVDGAGKAVMPQSRLLKISSSRATTLHQRMLNLQKGTPVWKIERVRILKKRPVINELIVLPKKLFPDLDRLDESLPNTLYDFYQNQFGIFIHQARETLSAVEAEPRDCKNIRVERGFPILEIRRIAYNVSGDPVELRTSRVYTRGTAYQITLR